MSTMPRLWMFELNFFCFACKTLLLAPACFLDDWIGLDWIFGERKREERRYAGQRRRAARTNERTKTIFCFCFLVVVVVFSSAPETRVCRSKTENRIENVPQLYYAGHKGKKILRQKKDAQRHADTCICMCVCTHTHTHTQRERFAHHVVSFLLFLRASCVKNNVRGSIPNYCMNFEYTIYTQSLNKIKNVVVIVVNTTSIIKLCDDIV